MKKIAINCSFGGENIISPFNLYIGEATAKRHPFYYQAAWLKEQRGGDVPQEAMKDFGDLRDIALSHDMSLEDLYVYTLNMPDKPKDVG